MTISNGLAEGSFPDSAGGGIYNDHSNLTVKGCALSGNSASSDSYGGGGIYSDGSGGSATLTVANSTLSGNSASDGYGGGISNNGVAGSATLTVVNSTLSGNSASQFGGGGIDNDTSDGGSAVTVANSTLSDNFGGAGIVSFGLMTVGNTILKTDASVSNIDSGSSVTSLGYNLSNDNGGGFLTGTGDQIDTDPILGPLKDNGGPTLTYAPLSNSPAIDMGQDIGLTGKGQRGGVRPVTYDASMTPPTGGDRSDIGAVELAVGVQPISVVSRKTHGAAGDFDINLPLSGAVVGIECRSGGVTSDYQVILTFAEQIGFTSAVITSGSGSVTDSRYTRPTRINGSGEFQVIVDLTGVTSQQVITLALFDAKSGGNVGDVGIRMGMLVGDTTADGDVDASDIGQTRSQSGQGVSGSNFREDLTLNGVINASDVGLVKSKSGTLLP
jgi:hypothetical protein